MYKHAKSKPISWAPTPRRNVVVHYYLGGNQASRHVERRVTRLPTRRQAHKEYQRLASKKSKSGEKRFVRLWIDGKVHGKAGDAMLRSRWFNENERRYLRKKNPSSLDPWDQRNPKYPTAADLIRRCRELWESYLERPSKKRLKPVLSHLEMMKVSGSKKVKEERGRCLRVANNQARALGLK